MALTLDSPWIPVLPRDLCHCVAIRHETLIGAEQNLVPRTSRNHEPHKPLLFTNYPASVILLQQWKMD